MLKKVLKQYFLDNIFRRSKSAVLPPREDVDTGSIHPRNKHSLRLCQKSRGFLETFNKKYLSFTAIVILLILVRFLWLDKFPVGINHDETDVILSAKSYWKFSTDLSGIAFPKSLVATKTDAGLSGLPSFILTPFIGPLKTSLVNARIPFVIINLLTIFIILLIVRGTIKENKMLLIIILVSLLNPWLYFYARSPTEAPISLLFSVTGIYLLIKYRDKRIFYSLPFFVASFFSYQGAKPVIPLLVLGMILIHKKLIGGVKNKIYVFYTILFSLFVVIYFFASSYYSGSTFSKRKDEVIFFNINKYARVVDERRRVSLEFPYKALYFNKLTYLLGNSLEKYLGAISPNFLFFRGDSMVPFQEHGVLYLIDLFFILLGIVALRKIVNRKDRYLTYLVILLALVGPASSAISVIGNQYIFRSFLYIPLFVILISFGIFSFLEILNWNKVVVLGIAFVYIFSFFNFLTFLFFRYSVSEQENHFLAERIVANYLIRAKESNKPLVVVTKFPYRVFYEYAFFANYLDNAALLPTSKNKEFSDDNIKIVDGCFQIPEGATYLVEQGITCPPIEKSNFSVIENQKDSGTIYKVYNDILCQDVVLVPWRRQHLLSDYSVENMDSVTFCRRWINKYDE